MNSPEFPSLLTASYWNPTQRFLFDGALAEVPKLVSAYQPKTILLVMGGRSFRSSDRCAQLKRALGAHRCIESVPVEANPTLAFVEGLRREGAACPPNLMIAVGGGSVIDCAKALRLLWAQPGEVPLQDYLAGRSSFQCRGLPLIAVPTTAGTGSEVTPYASLQTADRKKVSLTHAWLFPDAAVIDPTLTHDMPPYLTACTGLDALSQAMESFWSIHASSFSRTHALRAVSLIAAHWKRLFKNPKDTQARFALSLASTEAGLAISQSRTTAVHAVSYPLTTLFHISHGHACALTLPAFIRFNAPALDEELAGDLWKALGALSAEEAAQIVEQMMVQAGLERRLGPLGLTTQDIETVVENGARSDRAGNNPRKVSPDALREILQGIY